MNANIEGKLIARVTKINRKQELFVPRLAHLLLAKLILDAFTPLSRQTDIGLQYVFASWDAYFF
jgi:hypothetical protein